MRRSLEATETGAIGDKLQKIEKKIKLRQEKHQETLNRIKSEAKLRNT